MLNFLKIAFIILVLTACSRPKPQNKWQYDAISMSKKYQTHFLQSKQTRADLDLAHAKKLASQSADLSTLIDIELVACALQVSVLHKPKCEDLPRLLAIQNSPRQLAYYHLLKATIAQDEIPYLPSQYQDFAYNLDKEQPEDINKALSTIKPLSSRLVASSLAKDYINEENIDILIELLSFNGYKRPLISWLAFKIKALEDSPEKTRLQIKIEILKSH